MKRIILTGGGTAGHVTPNIALMERLYAEGDWEIHYLGTKDGMERELIAKYPYVSYHTISSGKVRRYFSWQNFTDPFRVLKGVFEARKHIRSIQPDVIFSKGGFVSVPVVIAAGRVPVVLHESDFTPGLANRIASPFCDHICVSFEDSLAYTRKGKGVFTGAPIRAELYRGDVKKALAFTGLSGEKPVLLVIGGSLGSLTLNRLVRDALDPLTACFDIVHLCGKGKLDESLHVPGYVQYEYISNELPDLLALADVVVSRAGANAVSELLALNKPTLLLPLTTASTRGDQMLNADYFARRGYGRWADEKTATTASFVAAIDEIFRNRDTYIRTMEQDLRADGTDEVIDVIKEAARKPHDR